MCNSVNTPQISDELSPVYHGRFHQAGLDTLCHKCYDESSNDDDEIDEELLEAFDELMEEP